MKLTVIIEGNPEEGYCCYTEENINHCGLIGQGDTLEECKKDFLVCIDEVNEWGLDEDWQLPDFEIEWRMAS